jgi:hypothetical protein
MNTKCPTCNRAPIQSALCNKHNPLFDCKIDESHVHHWCLDNHAWVELTKDRFTPQDEVNEKKKLDTMMIIEEWREYNEDY